MAQSLKQSLRASTWGISRLCCRTLNASPKHPRRNLSLPPKLNSNAGDKFNNRHKVLGYSSLILQDGIDIRELPMVVRRLDASHFPFTDTKPSTDSVKPTSEVDTAFCLQLQACHNVEDVLRLLEVPGDCVSAYSSAVALDKLSTLDCSADYVSSFIKKAILNELCETAIRGLSDLSNETVINVAKCILNLKTIDGYMNRVNVELETRIGESAFTILELCQVIAVISEHTNADQSVAKYAWVHIGNRYTEMDQTNIPTVCQTMAYFNAKYQNMMWDLMAPRLVGCMLALQPTEVSKVVRALILRHGYIYTVQLELLKWTDVHIHLLTDSLLQDILATFLHFNFSSHHLVHILKRYILAKREKVYKTVVAMAMDYCRQIGYLDTHLFNAVARDLEKNIDKYKAHELFFSLRPFGQLNYQAPNMTDLFYSIEYALLERIHEFEAANLVELLASFTYIERYPLNFAKVIFNPRFRHKINGIPSDSRRGEACQHYMELQGAIKIECPTTQFPVSFMGHTSGQKETDSRTSTVIRCIQGCLYSIFEKNVNTEAFWFKYWFPFQSDLTIFFDEEGKVIPEGFREHRAKLSFCIMENSHRCIHPKDHLKGKYALKKRLMEKLGHHVVMVEANRMLNGSPEERRDYIEKLIAPFMELLSQGPADVSSKMNSPIQRFEHGWTDEYEPEEGGSGSDEYFPD